MLQALGGLSPLRTSPEDLLTAGDPHPRPLRAELNLRMMPSVKLQSDTGLGLRRSG